MYFRSRENLEPLIKNELSKNGEQLTPEIQIKIQNIMLENEQNELGKILKGERLQIQLM